MTMTRDESCSGSEPGANLRDLERYYDDPLRVRALLIEFNAWDLENDCFVPEMLFETEETSTPSLLRQTTHPPDASGRT